MVPRENKNHAYAKFGRTNKEYYGIFRSSLIIDLFTDTAAILISIVSNSYYGMPRGQIHINLPPGHPIIAIRNNRNQNGRRIGKKVC